MRSRVVKVLKMVAAVLIETLAVEESIITKYSRKHYRVPTSARGGRMKEQQNEGRACCKEGLGHDSAKVGFGILQELSSKSCVYCKTR